MSQKNQEQIDPKLEKWLRWIEVIKSEITDLVVTNHIFHETQKLIANNSKLPTSNDFYGYLRYTYVTHVVMGLRRQIKVKPESISMSRLLCEVSENPQILSRAHFVSLYVGSEHASHANDDFDKFATPDATHINADLVKKDLEEFKRAVKKCECLSDRRIAHRDTRAVDEPTYDDIEQCICLLDKLYSKYYLLFRASSMHPLLPAWQYDWKEVFRTPWITGD
jgi:AbiU2